MRRVPFLLLLLLGSCGRAPAPETSKHERPAAPARSEASAGARDRAASAAAAEALREYYDLIEAGDYRAAYRMRTAGGADEARFATNFAAYESYRALVGAPSDPVASGDFVYVQAPVMITGRFRGGKPFGSSGNVMLRRPRSAASGWQVLADR